MMKNILITLFSFTFLFLSCKKKEDTNVTPTKDCTAKFAIHTTANPDSIYFTSESNPTGATYSWDFGDGTKSTSPNPVHVYQSSREFNVCLTVSSGTCSDSWCDMVRITPSVARLIFVFKFDSTQARLNNFGQPASLPAGHAGQSPHFNKISAHYIELAQDSLTPLTFGKVLYKAPETTLGGSNAIDFDSSVVVSEGQIFFSIPFSQLGAGTYKWLRVSLAYQNYDIKIKYISYDLTGTIASFIGFNTYIRSYTVRDTTFIINANKLQGYWGFATNYGPYRYDVTGQAPPGATTVPNPISTSSPIPPGSCVVTGAFSSPLTITGTETYDKVITVSLSTNKSFEWIDNGNGIYEPDNGELVVDMGIRGLIPYVN